MNKKVTALAVCLFFFSSALALEVEINKQVFYPGEEKILEVYSQPDQIVKTALFSKERVIMAGGKPKSRDGFKVLSDTIDILDRPGEYRQLFWVNDLMEEKIEINYSVKSLKPAALTLSLVGLAERPLKDEAFTLGIMLTRDGLPVENARVRCWPSEGRKIELEEKGQGDYEKSFVIPVSFTGKEFTFDCHAVESEDDEADWGVADLTVPIKEINIGIELVEPLETIYTYNEPFEAVFRINYPNAPEPVIVQMKQDILTLDLYPDEDNLYCVSFSGLQTLYGENTPLKFIMHAYDRHGNQTTEEFSFEQENYLFGYWKNKFLYVIFPAVFLLYLSYLGVNEYQKQKRKKKKARSRKG